MALVGSYSVTGFEAVTATDLYDNVDDLLKNLLDNNSNLIDPIDIRSPVYSLWKKVDDLSVVVATAASASVSLFYSNSTPTPVTIGGIPAGSTFSNLTISQMFDKLLYPYQSPVVSISVSGSNQAEYGYPVPLSSITLNWSVTKKTNDISSITVNSVPYSTGGPPWSTSVAGSQTTTGFYPVSPGASYVQTFPISVNDGTGTYNSSATFTWMNRIFWGNVSLSSISNPNLFYNPGSASMVSSIVTDTVIQNLSSQLSTTKNKSYSQIGGGGNYLVFAWPSSVSGATTPSFTVGGFSSNAFTRIRTAQPFVNQYGFTTNFEVWITNTVQNSALDVIVS